MYLLHSAGAGAAVASARARRLAPASAIVAAPPNADFAIAAHAD
jgi:hypothetical protein